MRTLGSMKRWFTSVTLLAFTLAGKHSKMDIEAHTIKLFETLVHLLIKKALAEQISLLCLYSLLFVSTFCVHYATISTLSLSLSPSLLLSSC